MTLRVSKHTVCIALLILALFIDSSLTWDVSMTHAEFLFDSPPSLEDLSGRKMLYTGKMKCLAKTNHPGHSVNPTFNFSSLSSSHQKHLYLPGITIWINDWFAPGHVFYTFSLMQAIYSSTIKIDRIVIQRPPCFRDDFCGNIGIYHSFYQLYYQSIIPVDIPLYLRWYPNETYLQAINLTSSAVFTALFPDSSFVFNNHTYTINQAAISEYLPSYLYPPIPVRDVTCFEHVLSRLDDFSSSYNSWTTNTIHKFRSKAYLIILDTNSKMGEEIREKGEDGKGTIRSRFSYFKTRKSKGDQSKMKIGFVWRGINASRHMNNHAQFFTFLQQTLPLHKYSLSLLDSSLNNLTAKQQALFVYEHQIIIAEHGAFQGNLIYARNGTLLIDLRSNAHLKNPTVASTYELFAQMFRMLGVFHSPVTTIALSNFASRSYQIQMKEMQEVVDLIVNYTEKEKPFLLL